MRSAAPEPAVFQVVVPVKRLMLAKSRLKFPDETRRSLALAFLLDTLRAAADCVLVGDLVVVTHDHQVTEVVEEQGARVVSPDGPPGLNGEVGQFLAERDPRDRPTAIVMADLPALTATELREALTRGYEAHGPQLWKIFTTVGPPC